MFQIKIHPIDLTPDQLKAGKSNLLYKMRLTMCNKYKDALLYHISNHFTVDELNETLYLKFYATNDKIKEDYSHIKDKTFKAMLQQYVRELHSGIGLIF